MNGRTFSCPRLHTPGTALAPGLLRVTDGVVAAVESGSPAPGATHLDGTVVPGFVDLQVNGLGPRNVLEGTIDAITGIARDLAARGVTAWLPTIVSAPQAQRLEALDAVAEAHAHRAPDDIRGARVLGAHLEGPWIAAARAGAHDTSVLEAPTRGALEGSLGRHPGLVRIVTLAPELDGGVDAVRQVTRAGAVASIGHTDASFEEAMAAGDAGVRMATHLFNAMRPIHQRDPGVIAAVLADRRITAGLISDGTHVHPSLVALAFRNKPGRVALVSDVVAGMGRGAARLDTGILAGSLDTLDAGVRVAAASGVTFREALTAATRTPADLLGEPYGRLEPGAPADFVVLDEDLCPQATYVGGELVWER